MVEYAVAMQIERCSAESPPVFAAGSVLRIRGVRCATVDPASGAMTVRFDRALVTIGDLVRWIEDQGLAVGSVAQERIESGAAARAATG
ncbi:MAG: hypothetical protein KF699_07375 [Phycisphaeraceae bacterium]|nr:hypothetical protein [Phycisphaeraceae bacterium]